MFGDATAACCFPLLVGLAALSFHQDSSWEVEDREEQAAQEQMEKPLQTGKHRGGGVGTVIPRLSHSRLRRAHE